MPTRLAPVMNIDQLLALPFTWEIFWSLGQQRNRLPFLDRLLTSNMLVPTIAELMWFTNLLKSLGYYFPPTTLYCNSINAINMPKNLVYHHRTKHIEIDVHFVPKQVARSILSLAHVSGTDQVEDIFT